MSFLAKLADSADPTAYGQLYNTIAQRQGNAREMVSALAAIVREAKTPRHVFLARGLLYDLAQLRPDAFTDCLGSSFEDITATDAAFVALQRWMAGEMAAASLAACITRERGAAEYWERHKHEATPYDAEEACTVDYVRDADHHGRWTMVLRWIGE